MKSHLEAAGRVDGADVARVKPALVVERLLRILLVLVVAALIRVDTRCSESVERTLPESKEGQQRRTKTLAPLTQSSPRGMGESVER